jgi:uncharacterized protein (TIGR02996 family)
MRVVDRAREALALRHELAGPFVIDLMAVVSLSTPVEVGTKLRMDRFVSTEPGLAPLARGGRLYLVTLRPPPEKLWLVAILDQPMFDGTQWIATASEIPVTDITELRSKLEFASGTGWTNWCESCQQTHWYGADPRSLTPDDTALLDRAAGISADPARALEPVGSGKRLGSLLDAIVDNPASDEARRVYADQLLADNDLRGEYILIDIALAGPLSMRKREQLAARRAHLLAGYSAIWWPYKLARWETRKGFLRGVHGTWQQIAAIAPELFACEPVTEVGIHSIDEAGLTELLASPWLPRLDRLIVRRLPGDAAFATLASSSRLANLRALNVCGNQLRAGAFSNIANALPRVQNLVLTGNPIDDDGLEALRAWEQLANVDTLYLSDCEIGARGLERLLAGARLDKLVTLTLSHNAIGDAGVAALVKHAAQLPALEHLELKSCAISSTAAEALLNAELPELRRLDVRRNKIDPMLARADPRLVV